jgi:hypothetical protein
MVSLHSFIRPAALYIAFSMVMVVYSSIANSLSITGLITPAYVTAVLVRAVIFAAVSILFDMVYRVEYFNNYMPDSQKTTCAKGSVPAGNGLDCRIPTDIYGL